MAVLVFILLYIFVTIYTVFIVYIARKIFPMTKKCRICGRTKLLDCYYKLRNACKDCLNIIRNAKEGRLVVCKYCKQEFKPARKGRYKFCNEICRFRDKYLEDKVTGCWNWIAGKDKLGYGNFVPVGGKNGLAHRASFRLFRGEIPKSKLVLHRCNNPSCVNPEHLYIGTDADNTLDKLAAGHQHSPAGINCHFAKLTEDNVRTIRSMKGLLSYKMIAEQFNVNEETIGAIIRRKSWKHID